MKKVAILGSTGSIGESALRVIDLSNNEFQVVALSAFGRKIDKIKEQCLKYKPKYLIIDDINLIRNFQDLLPEVEVMHSSTGYQSLADNEQFDVTVVGTVGISGLVPSFIMSTCSRIIAIANKEAIIYGGKTMLSHIAKHNCKIIPVDSEHNSLYQLLRGLDSNNIKKMIITASGGAFVNYQGDLSKVGPEQALAHPKWSMGHKCTIDSASLINKGIELIEASILFNIDPNKIECIIHPQVIIHALIEMNDNAMFGFLSNPNMSLHLSNAMRDNNEKIECVKSVDLVAMGTLEFRKIDDQKFPGVKLARQALSGGRSHVISLNVADEVLVDAFMENKIGFTQIGDLLESVLEKTIQKQSLDSVEEILEYSKEITSITLDLVKSAN